MPKTAWVIPTRGSTTDANHWTDWEPVASGSTAVYLPRPEGNGYKEVPPGQTVLYKVFTGGMAGVNFTIRYDCDPETMICRYGDSTPVEGLDGPGLIKRKGVGYKPDINTAIELTWGCSYTDKTHCSVNPSCIIPDSTAGSCYQKLKQDYFDKDATYKIHTDALLYHVVDGKTVQVPLPAGAFLDGPTYFDITCVNGFTLPVIMQVRRPHVGGSRTYCTTASPTPIDDPNISTWQTVADTKHLSESSCPSDVMWTPPRQIKQILGSASPVTDGYNVHVNSTQQGMPWVVEPAPGAKLKSTFHVGLPLDLKVYRNPAEIAATASSNLHLQASDVIGCASPCSLLTKRGASSAMYSEPGGHYAENIYVQPGEVLLPGEPGVTDVCCGAQKLVTTAFSSAEQCNTSKYWHPPAPIDAFTDYAFGFYASDYAPPPGTPQEQPWWDSSTPTPPRSLNPYQTDAANRSAYVAAIRNHQDGQSQTTRAYAWPHDDAWSTLVCHNDDPTNLQPIDRPNGSTYYKNYDVRVIIGNGTLPTD